MEAREDEAVRDFAHAFCRAANELIVASFVVGEDAACPEGTVRDRGVEDVHGGLGDCAFGGVRDAVRDRQRERNVDRLVGGAFLEVEGGGTRDVGCREGGARAVASRDDGCGGVNEADVRAGDFDRGVLGLEVPGVVAAVADEVLEFDPGIGVSERAALGLEDGTDALVWRDHVEPGEQVVVRQRKDALGRGE